MIQIGTGLKAVLTLLFLGILVPPAQSAQLNFEVIEQNQTRQACQHQSSLDSEPAAQLPKPVALVAVTSDIPLGLGETSTLAVANDCCGVNGASQCALGGLAPEGGVGGGGFPFPALAALAPVAGVPFLIAGGETGEPSNPSSSGSPSVPPISTPAVPPSTPLTPDAPATPPTEPVPEPSTMLGLLLGGGAVGNYLRRKKRHAVD